MTKRLLIFVAGLSVLTTASEAQDAFATVNLDTAGNTWTYVVGFFDPGQTSSLRSFYLPVGAPVSNFRIEGEDHGWTAESDGLTYVRWFNPGPAPSADDLHSGEFMVFLLDSPGANAMQVSPTLTSWNAATGGPGQEFVASTFAPVPEPASCVALGTGALAFVCKKRKRLL